MAFQRLLPNIDPADLPGELPFDPYVELEHVIRNVRLDHVQRRALSRFGMVLSETDVSDIVYAIRNKGSRYLAQRGSVALHLLRFFGHDFYVVYDFKLKQVKTILTEDYARSSFAF